MVADKIRTDLSEWQWTLWFLIVSVILHLLGWWFLDRYTLRNELPVTINRPTSALSVVFINQPRPDTMPPSIESKPGSATVDKPAIKHETVPKLSRSPDKAKTAQRLESATSTKIETDVKVQSPRPKLNLSKILDDVHQLAKEAENPADEQQFDKRKPRINPDNLKAPDVKETEEIESYKSSDGDLHVCHRGLNGKKVCAHVAQQDLLNPLDIHVFQYDLISREKTPGDLLGERLQEVINPKKPHKTDEER
jgi:hypothetical protein